MTTLVTCLGLESPMFCPSIRLSPMIQPLQRNLWIQLIYAIRSCTLTVVRKELQPHLGTREREVSDGQWRGRACQSVRIRGLAKLE